MIIFSNYTDPIFNSRDPNVAEQLHCSLHVKELKITTTELETQVGD